MKFTINNEVPDIKINGQSIKNYKPKNREFTQIEEGVYDCRVDSIEFDSVEKGQENFYLVLKVLEGNNKGKNIYQWFKFNAENEKQVFIHKKIFDNLLVSLGYIKEEMEQVKNNMVKYCFSLIDKNVRVKIIHKEWNGKTYANIDKMLKCVGDKDNGTNLLKKFEEKNKRIEKVLNMEDK